MSTVITDFSVSPLPWQLELRRLSAELADSYPQNLTLEELQREARDFSPDGPDGTSCP